MNGFEKFVVVSVGLTVLLVIGGLVSFSIIAGHFLQKYW